MSDYYQLLEFDRGAGPEDIKRAYRRLARQYHPDVNGNDPASAERFKEINKAYSVLSDPDKRQRYDTYGEAGVEGMAGQGGRPVLDLRGVLRRPARPVLRRRRRPVRRRPLPDPLAGPAGRDHRHAAAPAVHRGHLRHLQGRPGPGRGHLRALRRLGGQAGHRADRLLALQRLRPAAHRPPVAARPAGHRHHLPGLLRHRPGDPLALPGVPRPGADDGGLHPHHRHPPGPGGRQPDPLPGPRPRRPVRRPAGRPDRRAGRRRPPGLRPPRRRPDLQRRGAR